MAPRNSRGSSKSSSEFADLLRKGKETYEAGETYEDMSFEKIPAGQYIARLMLAEWRMSKNKNLMLHREHIVLEGEQAGRKIMDHMMYGLSDFGDGKIRQYIKLATGEPLPSDPAELEDVVKELNDKYAYDCAITVTYSKAKDSDDEFMNATVKEVYDVDDKIDIDNLSKTSSSDKDDDDDDKKEKKGGKKSEDSGDDDGKDDKETKGGKKDKSADDDEDKKDRIIAFLKAQSKTWKEEMKSKTKDHPVALDPTDLDDLITEVGNYTYQENDLSDEDKDLLDDIDKSDCIEKAEPQKRGRR